MVEQNSTRAGHRDWAVRLRLVLLTIGHRGAFDSYPSMRNPRWQNAVRERGSSACDWKPRRCEAICNPASMFPLANGCSREEAQPHRALHLRMSAKKTLEATL